MAAAQPPRIVLMRWRQKHSAQCWEPTLTGLATPARRVVSE
jgi:hypothetical protein